MRDSTKIRILIITIIILLLIIFALAYLFLIRDDGIVIDPNATDIINPSDDGSLSDGGIKVIGFRDITVKADSEEISSYFINPAVNEVYFAARLYLDDGTFLYQSDLIPPGKAIYKIKIKKPLEQGSYNAVLYYDTYSTENMEKKSTAKVNFVIIAK